MSTIIVATLFVLTISSTLSNDIFREDDNNNNSCIEHVFNKILNYEKYVTINWSESLNATIKDEILRLFVGKIITLTVINWSVETSNWREHPNTVNDLVLLFAVNEGDFTSGISSVLKKKMWNYDSKFIIVYYMNESTNRRKSSSDPLIKNIVKMFAKLNALSVQIFYIYDDGIDEFTWLPYDGNNCERIDMVKRIGECRLSFPNHYLKRHKVVESPSVCSVTVLMEPQLFNLNRSRLSYGAEMFLVEELGRRLNFELQVKSSYTTDSLGESKEK